jgi:hypothetical protein
VSQRGGSQRGGRQEGEVQRRGCSHTDRQWCALSCPCSWEFSHDFSVRRKGVVTGTGGSVEVHG